MNSGRRLSRNLRRSRQTSAMAPRLQLSYLPRIFPRTVAKTCVLALCLLLWIVYLYSGSYVDERTRASNSAATLALSDNRSSSNSANSNTKSHGNHFPPPPPAPQQQEEILRRPTVPVFEGPALDTTVDQSPNSNTADQSAQNTATEQCTWPNATRNCSGAPSGDNSQQPPPNKNSADGARTARRTTTSTTAATLPAAIRQVRRGDYVVLQNVLRARRSFGYDKSITLTTHATYELLDNLVELSRRWEGPVSVAIYAPRTDFGDTLLYALWLRRCHKPVADLVTFHFVFPAPGVQIRVPTLRPPTTAKTTKSTRNITASALSQPANTKCHTNITGNDSTVCANDRPPPTLATDTKTVLPETTTVVTTTTTTQETPYDYVRVLLDILAGDGASSSGPSCRSAYPAAGPTYRSRHRLPYPINVCRNAARLTARTHFLLASDIELYPSAGVIAMFLNFSRRSGIVQSRPVSTVATGGQSVGSAGAARPQAAPPAQPQPSSLLASLLMGSGGGGSGGNAAPVRTRRVFVLPIFEVEKAVGEVPSNKRDLVALYRKKKAVYFHKYVCSFCNIIPRLNRWLTAPVPRARLNLFMSIKRQKPFNRWEPIYIGTNEEPLYNELLTWEGQQDKMTQMYEICLLNYDLAILDNAFLVHRPGIKRKNATEYRLKSPFISQNNKVYKTVIRELEKEHGINPWCK